MKRALPLLGALVVALLLACVDLVLASLELRHPVVGVGEAGLQVLWRWMALGLGSSVISGVIWARRHRPSLLPAVSGLLAAVAVASAWARARGARSPLSETELQVEVASLALAGLFAVVLAGRFPRSLTGVLALLWLALASPSIPGDTVPTGQSEAPAGAPDVLFLTLDTFREDALSASPRALVPGLTPTLDGLASAGCRVDDAQAPAPLTGPSHAALLTGQTPAALGLLVNGGFVGRTLPRLPDRFAAAGWSTGAFVSSAMVAGGLGYDDGFDVFNDDLSNEHLWRASSVARLAEPMSKRRSRKAHFDRNGSLTVEAMDAWLAAQSHEPVFVWLHLYDAHAPYKPSDESKERVKGHDLEAVLPDPQSYGEHPAVVGLSGMGRLQKRVEDRLGERGAHMGFVGPRMPGNLVGAPDPTSGQDGEIDLARTWKKAARYLADVADTDAIVAEALASLDRHRGERARMVVVVGDHGESLTEHNELASHQQHLYRANLAVPLILPDGSACPEGPVSTVGVGRALLDATGLDSEGYPSFAELPVAAWVEGRAHAGDDESTRVEKAAVMIGSQRAVGIRDGAWVETYDLSLDAHELQPEAEVSVELNEALAQALSDLGQAHDNGVSGEISPETAAALEALGYVGQ